MIGMRHHTKSRTRGSHKSEIARHQQRPLEAGRVPMGHGRDGNVFNKELQRWKPQIGGLSHCQGSEQGWSLHSL